LSVAHVQELLTACGESGILVLDLSDLVSADQAGIAALQQLRERGATLIAVPGYLRLKLEPSQGPSTDAHARPWPRRIK
jgi:ABC-type transporter Mla MlaB component